MNGLDNPEIRGALTPRTTRRRFLARTLRLASGLAAASWLPAASSWAEPPRREPPLPEPTRELLATSGLVYVSPLHADGRESRCHGEVWFGWIDDTVVLITARKSWKARALERGLDRARIWVGDHGRWKGWIRNNEDFRGAPHFEALASRSQDRALLEQLMSLYVTKYPEEFGGWEERMRTGFDSGERVLIRYSPIA